MLNPLIILLLVGAVSSTGDEPYSVSIITEPSHGPFRFSQQVQFSCVIDPMPPDPVSYQWRTVENLYGGSSYVQQSFNRTYSRYGDYLIYCYYYCGVLVNQTLVGSASKIVELQGIVYTNELVSRSFNHGGYLELNVNVFNHYVAIRNSSLVWYHNETRIFSGARVTISNNNTRLTIRNMRDYDAGSYKVNFSYSCEYPLPSFAIVAPVTFTVQERSLPEYKNPLSTIPAYYVTDDNATILLSTSVDSRADIRYRSSYWYRNGIRVTGEVSTITDQDITISSLQTNYSDTDDVGIYIGVLRYRYGYSSLLYEDHCRIAESIDDYYYSSIPIGLSIWSIKVYRAPTSVHLNFAQSTVMQLESTTVECTAGGGESAELFNLTLWRNDQLLAQVRGDYLAYSTTPQSYGTYTCAVDGLRASSILQERGPFQLLLNDISATQCQQLMNQDVDLKEAILAILGTLCQSCDRLYLDNIADTRLNCSTSGDAAYLTAALVYSSPDGQITATTLTNMLLAWLLSGENPALMVNGARVTLSQQCPTPHNTVTEKACINVFNSAPVSSPLVAVGFFAGLIAGIVLMIIVFCLYLCLRRLGRCSTSESGAAAPPDSDKGMEMTVSPNQAYETVDVRYQTGRLGQDNEVIYEVPAV